MNQCLGSTMKHEKLKTTCRMSKSVTKCCNVNVALDVGSIFLLTHDELR